MKKLLAVGIILLLVGMSIPSTGRVMEQPSTLSSNGNTLYVGGSGPGNYSKIQDAIDNANDGDTVFVYNGTYLENIIVDKSINLIGEDRNITVIDGNRSGDVVNITADWVNICGFTIQNDGSDPYVGIILQSNNNNISYSIILNNYYGIDLDCSNNNNISYNIISNNPYCGIDLDCSNNNTIRANTISNNHWGISLRKSINNIISNNSILGDNLGYGIYDAGIYPFQYSDNNIISGNKISDWNTGIFLNWVNNLTISENEISNNTYGIYFFSSIRHSVISGNIIFGNDYGIRFNQDSTHNLISRNIFRNNNFSLLISKSWKNNISRNIFIKNGWGICFVWFSLFNKIYHNNFINNRRNAEFYLLSLYNKWEGNYWGRNRLLPKPIFGNAGFILPIILLFLRLLTYYINIPVLLIFLMYLYAPSWVNFDWHPAKEPYDIEV